MAMNFKNMSPKSILIAVSNHPPEGWPAEQKRGWTEIVYLPFPNVPSSLSREEVWEMAEELAKKIVKIWDEKAKGGNDVYLWIAGDYSLTIFTIRKLEYYFPHSQFFLFDKLVFPTTERVVEEEKDELGNIVKKSIFKFVQWR